MSGQSKLGNLPVDEEEARRIALLEIREKMGTIPSPGTPRKEDSKWIVPIIARYPRVIYHEDLSRPERVRFMDFGEVGNVELSALTGLILNRSGFFEVQQRIQSKLSLIRNTVEMALVKSNAGRFARLAFAEHMHSPVVDLLAWIMLNGEMKLGMIKELSGAEEDKYLRYAQLLQDVGLLKITPEAIAPTPFFVEIEGSEKPLNDRLTDALAFYFARGYEQIDSVRQFVGPQLAVTGFSFGSALEAGKPVPTEYSVIDSFLVDAYGDRKKTLQLPRYLAQLEGVGLLERTRLRGEPAWSPSQEPFQGFVSEGDILEPIHAYI